MLAYLVAYASSAALFLAADFAWLTLAGPRLYRPVLGPMLAERPNLAAAICFYALYLTGVMVLAIAPALKSRSWTAAAVQGLLLGLVAYGTYDLTNQATLRVWATRLTLADMLWGGVLTAAAALAGYVAARQVA